MALPLLLSRFRVVDDQFRASVTVDGAGPTAIEIPVGTYYLDSATASESLVAELDARLEAAFAGEDFTVTRSATTGKVTIACTTGNIDTWTWTDTAFRDALGFTANFGPVASATGANVAQFQIFAASGRSNYTRLRRRYTGGMTRARNGRVAVCRSNAIGFTSEWTHEFEPLVALSGSPPPSGTWDDDLAVVPWVWSDFFDHHMATYAGEPFRYYELDTDALSAYEDEYVLVNAPEFLPERGEANRDTYWRVALEVQSFQ